MQEDHDIHLQELFERLRSRLDDLVYLDEPFFALNTREVTWSDVPVLPDGVHATPGDRVPSVSSGDEGNDCLFLHYYDQLQAAAHSESADSLTIFAKLALQARARLSEAQWGRMLDLLDS